MNNEADEGDFRAGMVLAMVIIGAPAFLILSLAAAVVVWWLA